jgi:hypothetical protein
MDEITKNQVMEAEQKAYACQRMAIDYPSVAYDREESAAKALFYSLMDGYELSGTKYRRCWL